MNDGPHLVTISVIARRFGVSRTAIYKWTKHPKFPAPSPMVEGAKVYDWHKVCRWKIKETERGWRP